MRRNSPDMNVASPHDPKQWYQRNKLPLPLWLEESADHGSPTPTAIAEFHELDRSEHQRTLWCHFANVALGLWLAKSPFILGFADNWMQAVELVTPTGPGLA